MRKKIIAANWKMNGEAGWAEKPGQFRKLYADSKSAPEILICPPSLYLRDIVKACGPHDISVGAQNCYFEASGAFTGEISAPMIKDCGAGYVILGHSERRNVFGEGCADVAKKAKIAIEAGLVPVICVGEKLEQREKGEALKIVTLQLDASLPENKINGEIVIAYEPVWAIGTGKTASAEDAQETCKVVRSVVAEVAGAEAAAAVRI